MRLTTKFCSVLLLWMFCIQTGALAADPHTEGGASLPQLDHTTFVSQVGWLIITFAVLYILMSRIALPRVRDILEAREQRIQADIRKVQENRAEIEMLQARLEQNITETQAEVQDMMAAKRKELLALHAERLDELDRECEEQIAEAQKRIDALRDQAAQHIGQEAAEVALTIIARMTPAKADATHVRKVAEKTYANHLQ